MWLAACTTILFESIAHVSGAWYSVGEGVFRLFGLIPLESFLLTFVQFVYLVLLHEFFVDDKRLHSVRFDRRRSRLFWLLTSLLIIGLFQATVFAEFFLSYAFMGMIIGLVLTLAIAAVSSHRASKKVFEKALLTVVLSIPIFILYEVLALQNVYTVFANTNEYLLSFTVWGSVVPVEKLVQLIIMPLFLVVIYELYFDDAK